MKQGGDGGGGVRHMKIITHCESGGQGLQPPLNKASTATAAGRAQQDNTHSRAHSRPHLPALKETERGDRSDPTGGRQCILIVNVHLPKPNGFAVLLTANTRRAGEGGGGRSTWRMHERCTGEGQPQNHRAGPQRTSTSCTTGPSFGMVLEWSGARERRRGKGHGARGTAPGARGKGKGARASKQERRQQRFLLQPGTGKHHAAPTRTSAALSQRKALRNGSAIRGVRGKKGVGERNGQ
jgi:hypothetical protein